MGDSCTQVGEPAVEKTGRPEGLPRTAFIKRLCDQFRYLMDNALASKDALTHDIVWGETA
ncbi:hypothetical protein [Pseudomonas sp. 25 E 4]|nr:hypothetical protein [Pseudomonas sp. 25 E 4]